MIIIIGSETDFHIKKVIEYFKDWNVKYSIINQVDFGFSNFSSIWLGSNEIKTTFNYFDFSDVKSVWLRNEELRNRDLVLQEGYHNYVTREKIQYLSSVYIVNENKVKWINKFSSNYRAQHKPYNLKIAQDVGFKIPNTYYGNNPFDLYEYLENDKFYAVKAAYHGYVPKIESDKISKKGLYTQKLTGLELLNSVEELVVSPLCIQEYIEKDFELRITVVGKNIFACKIESQKAADPNTHIDWRHYDLKSTPHSEFTLPKRIQQNCLELMNALDLTMGCIDMIVDPQGNYYYLEINPKGQWYWIEEITGMKITEALAKNLAGIE